MRKLCFGLMLLTLCAIALPAAARVCFLPDRLAGNCGDDDNVFTSCLGFTRSSPCPATGYDSTYCSSAGQTLYNCSCRSDNYTPSNGLGTKYLCTKTYDPSCGCSREDTICNRDIYRYRDCSAYPHTVPKTGAPDDTCTDPSTGDVWYKECICDSGYSHDCKQRGLANPPSSTEYCETPNGTRRYPYCNCASDWVLNVSCIERTDGCTNLSESVESGRGTCYHCSNENCAAGTNLEVKYCDQTRKIITNCESLGYTQTDKCPDGSIGPRCPFDKSFMFCQLGG